MRCMRRARYGDVCAAYAPWGCGELGLTRSDGVHRPAHGHATLTPRHIRPCGRTLTAGSAHGHAPNRTWAGPHRACGADERKLRCAMMVSDPTRHTYAADTAARRRRVATTVPRQQSRTKVHPASRYQQRDRSVSPTRVTLAQGPMPHPPTMPLSDASTNVVAQGLVPSAPESFWRLMEDAS